MREAPPLHIGRARLKSQGYTGLGLAYRTLSYQDQIVPQTASKLHGSSLAISPVSHEREAAVTSCLVIFVTLLHSMAPPGPGVGSVIDGTLDTFPYPVERPLEWQWVQKGLTVGSTKLQIKRSDPLSKRWTLDARLLWSQPGRTMEISNRSDYQLPSNVPLSTRRESRIGASGAGEKRGVVASEVDLEEASIRIVVQDPARGSQVDRTMAFPTGTVLLENQAFEHWLLIGLLLDRTEQRHFKALIPSEFRILDLELKRDRAEKIGSIETTRWSVLCADFTAKVWTGPGGTIEKYAQGELEIRRIHVAAETPPPDPEVIPAPGGQDR